MSLGVGISSASDRGGLSSSVLQSQYQTIVTTEGSKKIAKIRREGNGKMERKEKRKEQRNKKERTKER